MMNSHPRVSTFSKKRLVSAATMAVAGGLLVSGVFASAPQHHTAASSATIHAQTVAATTISNNISVSFGATGYAQRDRYNTAISAIRNRVMSSTLYNGIIAERPSNQHDYFAVHLQATDGTPQLSLVMDAANLYVVGFWDHGDNIYYRMGSTGPLNPVGAATVVSDYIKDGDYTYLTGNQAGNFDRSKQAIDAHTIRSAITGLLNANSTLSEDAYSITLLITAFSEAARFDLISWNVSQAIATGLQYRLGSVGVDHETSWASTSNYVRNRLADGRPVDRWVGTTHYTSLSAIASNLAVAYMAYNWVYSAS